MAVDRNEKNFLNRIQIKAVNNRRFFDDVRTILFITREYSFNPVLISNPDDILKLSLGNTEEVLNSEIYNIVASAYSQEQSPVKVVIYGNKTATTFSELFNAYLNNEEAISVTNVAIMVKGNMKYNEPQSAKTTERVFLDTIKEVASINKDYIFYVGIEKSQHQNIEDIIKVQNDMNLDNLVVFVEGAKNLGQKKYLLGAVLGGVIGAKEIGKYIVHSSKIIGFLPEGYNDNDSTKMKESGLNFLSKPTKGYTCLINGLASDNKMYVDLKLGQLWLADTLRKELTVLQITEDKLPFKEFKGIEYVRTVILNVVKKGASDGIFMTDTSKNVFGTIVSTDRDGNKLEIKLGYLDLEPLTQNDIREGLLNFNLMVTYDVGVRHITLNGTITTEGKLII